MKKLDFAFKREKAINMLYAIAAVMVVVWLLGVLTSHIMGGFIHVLLAIAILAFISGFFRGRHAVPIRR